MGKPLCRGAVFALLFLLGSTAWADKARFNYLLHCAGCHLADGQGSPPEVPTLIGEITQITDFSDGRAYLARVPGSSQAPISDAELADVLNYILTELNAPNLSSDFAPITAREVHSARENVLTDPLRERTRLWEQYQVDS
ncbi:cytochrome c, class I [Luminiphilus syltensis NOR5-1B]|uniref:Cytochrome c, class I n=1 Tax=Luminiphilus syltensis NOR5-1B TaxID=565045 RepID=B8KXQ8_9GAMM|nr:cytochrome c [Luminiphilus syltensis]EED35395.1 cytochrome c, class I [Luminiphilus syltensis NOR5-1B]